METITESWLANEAEVDLKIRRRIMPNINGDSPLLFFDGATMTRYRYPSKQMEQNFCRNPSLPDSCKPESRGFNPTLLGSEESTGNLDRLIHYIHVEGSTDRILSNSLNLCGVDSCANKALSLYKMDFGLSYVKRNVSIIVGRARAS
jgi:hypothetical protein